MAVRRWCCSAQTENEVSSCIGGVGPAVCAFWPCGSCVIFVGLFVGFQCTSYGH